MSRRYEFLEDGAQLITGNDLIEEFEDWDLSVPAALVLGNPWATAAVLTGTPDQIISQLRAYISVVEGSTE